MDLWDEPVFRALVEAMEDCMLTLDSQGRITGFHNPRVKLVPRLDDGAIGKRYDLVLPPEVALTFGTAIQSLERTGMAQTVNYAMEVEGQRRYLSARVMRPKLVDNGSVVLVVIWDVTGQALASRASREAEKVYQLLATNSSDVITVEDIDGRYIFISPSVERVFGYPPKEVVGRNRTEFIHPDDMGKLRQSAPGGQLVPPEGARARFRVRHKDGHWVWVEADSREIEWQGGPALLSSSRDITHRHRAEQELEEARQRAEAASRAKSKFVASISHDLRTPLHGLLGMAELLAQTHLTQEQQEYLVAVQESGDALLARLNDLLDLSKIESGRLDLEEVDFDLVEAVEGLTDILGGQATAKGVQLICQVTPKVPAVVKGDPQRLRQVLINLIGNAIKFTGQGEVDVRVSPAEEELLRFSVRDTGAGIPEEIVDHLLGRTQEVGVPRPRRRQTGIGLGLTIAKELVGLMGGQLQVEAAEGKGTTFYFDLPLPASKRASIERETSELGGIRVLATDENATNRQLIREILEQQGAEVELTSGGVEAIRNLLDDPSYDCVILNSILPDLDGISTAAMIRANRTLEKIPLVLMCSSADEEERQRCGELKINALLTKPVRREVLVRAVHEAVNAGSFSEGKPDGDGTILVVEDNDLNLRLARDILRRAGYGVVSARDGREALQQLEKHTVDAVLMDIQLPDMDGIEATSRIRSTPAWSQIPIIAMTAHAMKGDAERFLQAGVDNCLSKPVNQTELLSVLGRELTKR